MKLYKSKRKNKIFVTLFFSFALIVTVILLVVACQALLNEGITKRSGFIFVFTAFMAVGTILSLRMTQMLLYVSYSFEGSKILVHRGQKVSSLGSEDIKDFNTEDNKIKFRDIKGNQYTIPRDFEDFDEIQSKLFSIVSKKSS